ncbi:hypothetical protein FIBSPDRAFT_687161, partial [Athelia psychrophila]
TAPTRSTCPILTTTTDITLWKIHISSKFDTVNVTGFVSGDVKHYASTFTMATATGSGSGTPPTSSASVSLLTITHRASDTWEARDRKALSIIHDHISDTLAIEFSTLVKSKELMDAL